MYYSKTLTLCNSLRKVYDHGMSENIVTTEELRKDIQVMASFDDLEILDAEAAYLADEMALRLEFALIEANEILLSIRALANRKFVIKP